MEATDEKPGKPPTTRFSRSARNARIVEQAREGVGYDEIAREEQLTVRSVQRIVARSFAGREAQEDALHTHLQIDRVCQALRVAGEALKRGEVRAVGPFLKAVEKLDGYHSLAQVLGAPSYNFPVSDERLREMAIDRFGAEFAEEDERVPEDETEKDQADAPSESI